VWYSCDYTVVNSEPVRVKSEREALVRLYSSQSKPARVCVCGAAEESVSKSVRVGVRQCWKSTTSSLPLPPPSLFPFSPTSHPCVSVYCVAINKLLEINKLSNYIGG
jgi:hypothetical protein